MENKKKYMYLLPLVIALFTAGGILLGSTISSGNRQGYSQGETDYRKIQDIIHVLDQRYVDSVDSDKLFEKTIGEMLHNLDPHSNYIPANELTAMNEQIQGKFGGVGIRFFVIRDTLCVTNVLPNSPSQRAGLKAGDKIVEIDGQRVASKKVNTDKVKSLLKGQENTPVRMKIIRNGKKISKKVIRGSIPISSVDAAYMMDKTTGFIHVNSFSQTTADEFRRAANSLLKSGMKKLVLDVRNNGGGVLTGATQIVDEFLPAGLKIVETRGEHYDEFVYRSTERGALKNTKLVVLINEGSASASEILAGAIQDNDRGVIVGRRSFGKGLVQEDVKLADGSNLRLTIARYYTPTGRCIQKSYAGDIDDYYGEYHDRYSNGELYEIDSSYFVDSLKFRTPKGKVVYGGGGIMPDVFVPLDSSGFTYYVSELRFSNAFTTFAFDYVQNKRNKWKSALDFTRSFRVTGSVLNQFSSFGESEYQIPRQPAAMEYSKSIIAKFIKSSIAQQLFVEEGYYRVINETDKEVLAALKALK
ncbi:MAG: S41 family peptidase [Crocinitomicaceae bacterium]|nr:S41 family peptidase [Crocinitomicaceae bacterium]